MTSSVAGLTLSKVRPESASTSLPSTNIFGSGLTFTASATALFLSSFDIGHAGVSPGRGTYAAAGACLGSPSSAGYLTLTSSSKLTGRPPGPKVAASRRRTGRDAEGGPTG